jgi:DNA end-binding protein Ku
MLNITEHILDTKREEFDPAYLEDRYRTVLVEKLREKQAQLPTRTIAPAQSQQNVINLMDALKRSLAAERPPARTPAPRLTAKRATASSKPAPSKRSRSRRTG